MEKKFLGAIAFLNIFLVMGFLGFSQSSAAIEISGIITEHYRYLEGGQDEKAYELLTPASRKLLSFEEFKVMREQVGIEKTRLAKVYSPVVKGDLAVTPFVVYHKFRGQEYALFNIGVLRKIDGKWLLAWDLREIPGNMYIDLLSLLVRAEEKLAQDPKAFSAFSAQQQIGLKNQLEGSRQENSLVLKALKEIETQQPGQAPVEKEVYQRGSEEDISLHGGF